MPKPLADRKAAFARRSKWIAPLGTTSYTDQINNMVLHFDHLGVVEALAGPTDTTDFPSVIEVEDQHIPIPDVMPHPAQPQVAALARAEAPERQAEVDLSGIEKVRRFPGGLPVQVK